jgi:uncharacterized protein YndB with AHSA1/START domain
VNPHSRIPPARKKRAAVVIERTYQTHVEALWELWTTKQGFESWWAPTGCRSQVHTIDARAGGMLRYDMIGVEPAQIAQMQELGLHPAQAVRARFTEFEPNQRLQVAHIMDFVPGVEPYESLITVDFFPAGESTRMVVTIEPMHNEDFTQKSVTSFISQLRNLEGRFVEGRFTE